MKLHIQNYQQSLGILWISRDEIGPQFPSGDPFNLAQIDPLAQRRLLELLQIADEDGWDAYGHEVLEFARMVSICLERIQKKTPEAFDEESVFVCPEPLAKALAMPTTPINLCDWLSKFPTQATS